MYKPVTVQVLLYACVAVSALYIWSLAACLKSV